ncbi:TonB-dependent receptor plug domain-containing protein [Malaciobacter sp. WC5094]
MNKKLTTSLVASLLIATNLTANQTLDTITVTSATKSEQSIKDVTSNIEVITSQEIEERHFTNVSDALKTLSGIAITSNGGVGQLDSLFIRGVQAKRILILIDGIRYNEPAGLSGAPLAQLNIDDVEQIEVLKGASSGIWGADASGGVINIITKKSKMGTNANLGFEVGSFKTRKYIANISTKNKTGYVQVNANRIETDGISAYEEFGKDWDKEGLEKDGYSNNTYNIKGGIYLTQNDEVNLSFKKISARYDYDSSSADNLTNKSKIDHFFKSANYVHLNDNYKFNFSVSQSKFDRTQNTFNAKSLVNEFALQSDINYGKNSKIIFGLNKQNFEDINNERKYNTEAIYISNSNVFDKLLLLQTLRYDNNSKFEEKVTGKIGAKYNFTEDFNISSNYGTAYNAPSLGNLNYTPTLKPETTKSFDLNMEYKNFKVTYFETEIKDMINYKFVPSFHYFNEEGVSKFKGYELSYKKDVFEDTIMSLNYTHLSAKDSDKKDLARRAKRNLNFAVDYYGFSKIHINVNGSYVGTRYNSSDKTGRQTGRYTLWNTVVNYEVNKNLSTYLKVDNITDKYYQTVDGYATAGRSAYVGLNYKF